MIYFQRLLDNQREPKPTSVVLPKILTSSSFPHLCCSQKDSRTLQPKILDNKNNLSSILSYFHPFDSYSQNCVKLRVVMEWALFASLIWPTWQKDMLEIKSLSPFPPSQLWMCSYCTEFATYKIPTLVIEVELKYLKKMSVRLKGKTIFPPKGKKSFFVVCPAFHALYPYKYLPHQLDQQSPDILRSKERGCSSWQPSPPSWLPAILVLQSIHLLLGGEARWSRDIGRWTPQHLQQPADPD